MTDVRVTQGAIQTLYGPARPDVRVTQGAIQVLYSPARPDVRVTQGAVQVLHDDTSPPPPPPPPPVEEVTGSIRGTQLSVLTLAGGDADVRVTQSAVLALIELIPDTDVRITQSSVLALTGLDVDIRITQSAVLVLADIVPCATKWTQLLKITRTDGQIFSFTTLDRNLTFKGLVYQSCDSISSTAVDSSISSGAFGTMTIDGLFSDTGITEEDVFYGLFDGADVEAWIAPWETVSNESEIRIIAGKVGQYSQEVNKWSFELITPGAELQQRLLLDYYTPGCRFKLGDSRCAIVLTGVSPGFESLGTVTATYSLITPNSGRRRIFTDTGQAQASGYFDGGQLTWDTGDNINIVSEIKSYDGFEFEVRLPLPFEIQLGDTFTAQPGCDKLPETCRDKFNNFDNFGGFPHVPGEDRYFQTPNAK